MKLIEIMKNQEIKNQGEATTLSVYLNLEPVFTENLMKYFEDNKFKIYSINVLEMDSIKKVNETLKEIKDNYNPGDTIILFNKEANEKGYVSSNINHLYFNLKDDNFKIIIDSDFVDNNDIISKPIRARTLAINHQEALQLIKPVESNQESKLEIQENVVLNKIKAIRESTEIENNESLKPKKH